jgi:hypothetical protein
MPFLSAQPHPAPLLGLITPILIALSLLAGCAMPEPRPPRPDSPAVLQLPDYQQLAHTYNARIEALPRLWARTTGRIWYLDPDGRRQTDQAEGHLQFMAPERLLLTFGKVGHTGAILGSNRQQYWWIELDRQRRALIGAHARATPDRITELGLPIYPRDVIELLGIMPLPLETHTTSIAWSDPAAPARLLVVTTPLPPLAVTDSAGDQPPGIDSTGLRRLFLDPSTFEPARIEILDTRGQLRAVAQLSAYQRIAIPGAGPEVPRPNIPTEIYIASADENTTMRLRISDAEIGRNRPAESIFDLDRLLAHYGVREIIDLDTQPVPPLSER